MARPHLFAANWKMHIAPPEARDFARRFRERLRPSAESEYWFFPSAVSLEATATAFSGLDRCRVGAQDVYWEPKGAFTGATSAALARGAGATIALIGHSERRWVFGETEEQTGRKLRAVIDGGLLPVLCVGEKLEERERGETDAVVERQLRAALKGVTAEELKRTVIAYEPVWAIGTGRNATPSDAGAVHGRIRALLESLGAGDARVLYGGSVNRGNVEALLAEPDVNGVLVGGASLDPDGWADICSVN
jgi:triosephosphate isomerase (TIM)